jgi:hypothetical protein
MIKITLYLKAVVAAAFVLSGCGGGFDSDSSNAENVDNALFGLDTLQKTHIDSDTLNNQE